MKRLDREEPGDLLAVLVDVLQQEAVAPDAQPGIDSTCPESTLLGVEFAQRLLNAQQTLLARVRHGAAQVEDSASAVRRCRVLIGTPHLSNRLARST